MDEEIQSAVEPASPTGEVEQVNEVETTAIEETPETEQVDESGVPLKNREAEAKRKLAKSMRDTQPQATYAPQAEYGDNEQAINMIAEAIEARLAPSLSVLQKQSEESAIQEVSNRPFANELTDDIAKEFYKLPSNVPYSQRLDAAYKEALSKNIANLTQKSEVSGYKKAIEKVNEKKSASTSGAMPRGGTPSGKIDLSKLSDAEKAARWDEVLASYQN
jgi:hypothetical protein